MCIASHLVGKRIVELGRSSGWLFVALYLKQCATSLRTYRAIDNPKAPASLSVPVSFTFSGLPRIIPSFHRREIRRGSPKGDRLIPFYLSVFTFSKCILLSKRVTWSTNKFVHRWRTKTQHEVGRVIENLILNPGREIPEIRTIPLEQGWKFKPTWKTLPTAGIVSQYLHEMKGHRVSAARRINSSFVSLPFLLGVFTLFLLWLGWTTWVTLISLRNCPSRH